MVKQMRHLAKNLKGHMVQALLGPVFKLLEAVLELFVPIVMADMIDVGIAGKDTAYLLRGGLILLALAVGGVIFAMICQYFAAVAAGNFGKNLRMQLYNHVMRMSGSETARFGAGGLITRITNDANQIQAGVNMFIRLGTRVPFLVIGGLVMALTVNWRIGLVFVAAMPVLGLVLYLVVKKTLPVYGSIQSRQDELARLSGEDLDGVRVIRAFSRQQDEAQAFAAEGEALTGLLVRVGKLSALMNPITGLLTSVAIGVIVWLGGQFAFGGTSSAGEVVALVSYMNQILLAMIVGANLLVLFTRAMASGKRVVALLEVEPEITDGPGAQPDPAAPVVAFDAVTFAYYKEAEPALEAVSFQLRRGQTVGVIGGTGSGKSSLVNLMLRFYDVSAGQVCFGGEDVRRYTLHQLRQHFGQVPQAAAVFSGTVRYNLQMSAPGADDETLWWALRMAQAADFVEGMDGGLDAEIREGGKNLSGGQKQRLTIARALVRKPRILILDDASSALDYATDARLRKALAGVTRETGMTVLMISQRAASIRHADNILVMDEGRLVGSGTHGQLLEQNEVYREICASQGLLEVAP